MRRYRLWPAAAAVAAMTGLAACGGATDTSTPDATSSAPIASLTPSEAVVTEPPSVEPSPSPTAEAPSKLSLETLPATIGSRRVFAAEGGFGYSDSGDESTPSISIMSIGSPSDYAELKKNLGKDAQEVGDSGFCDTATTDPTCYFVTATEAFFISGQAPIAMSEVREVAEKITEIFA